MYFASLVLYMLAGIVFLLAAININVGKLNLVPLGLLLWVVGLLVSAHA